MQPRLKGSKKWSPLPQELVQQIRSVFRQSFQEHTKNGHIEVNGHIYPEEILIQVGYKAPGTLKQNNWEISIAYRKDKDNVLKLLHLAVDAIGALFEQFFQAENDHEFPRLWEEVNFEGRSIYVQYTTVNSALEAEADRLLGSNTSDESVAQGDWDDDIGPEHIKASLGIAGDEDEDEDPEDVQPGGKKPSTH